ncbi:hypothetical protein Pmani_000934 [Petrolisthes manimaculis]|uniref:Uncharacterized protein n=1 Tax=Petrolisthes manimaculis TaxID=1843537 RepID=A0AAE1UKT0_9EUCA|nr:hypothetical protein Pmani_000934 [Petrolisthes manimaculis]
MGRKGVEFEVEKRKEDRVQVNKPEDKKDDKKESNNSSNSSNNEPAEPEGWLENPRMMENMKYFVFAQSFVLFLTYGLPKMQQGWALLMDLIFK